MAITPVAYNQILESCCEDLSFVGNCEFIEALLPVLASLPIYKCCNYFFETLSFVGNCEFIEALLPIFICCNYLVSNVAIMF